MKEKIKLILLASWFICMFAFFSCKHSDEPTLENRNLSESTRSDSKKGSGLHVSEDEATSIAKSILFRDSDTRKVVNIEYIKTTSAASISQLGTDTIAYVINFSDEGGYAIVLSKRHIHPFVAGETKGSLSLSELKERNMIEKIEQAVMAEIATTKSLRGQSICYGGGHYFVKIQIKNNVSIHSPFNQDVVKHYPGMLAGTTPTACAVALSYSMEQLVYKNVLYTFSGINECLENGPGYNPVKPPLVEINTLPPATYTYNYEGSVAAMSNLIYDLGVDMSTDYSKTEPSTDLAKAHKVMKNLGAPVTDYHSELIPMDVGELLDNGYMVVQNIKKWNEDHETTVIAVGFESICGSGDPLLVPEILICYYDVSSEEAVYLSTYVLGLNDHSTHTSVETGGYFGVKALSKYVQKY